MKRVTEPIWKYNLKIWRHLYKGKRLDLMKGGEKFRGRPLTTDNIANYNKQRPLMPSISNKL